jgi:CRISPR/Cas system CMR-associated protein Cmr1 (group 7 of RAMP superfamily)
MLSVFSDYKYRHYMDNDKNRCRHNRTHSQTYTIKLFTPDGNPDVFKLSINELDR